MSYIDNPIIEPFRFWCQKILPLTYDDSLSYYELLCKVVNILNEQIIPSVNTSNTNVKNLNEAFNTLQKYVDDYFTNLNVQTEINNKLDTMASDGSLSNVIEPYFTDFTNSFNQQLINQSNDIQVLKSRVDEVTSVPSGSTVDNTELIDIRVGANGTTYPNAGDAVRNQVNILQNQINTFNNYVPHYLTCEVGVFSSANLETNQNGGSNCRSEIFSITGNTTITCKTGWQFSIFKKIGDTTSQVTAYTSNPYTLTDTTAIYRLLGRLNPPSSLSGYTVEQLSSVFTYESESNIVNIGETVAKLTSDNGIRYKFIDFTGKNENMYSNLYTPVKIGYPNASHPFIVDNRYYCMFIPCEPNTRYIISHKHHYTEFYDENMKYLSRVGTSGSPIDNFQFITPARAHYFSVVELMGYTPGTLIIQQGTEITADISPILNSTYNNIQITVPKIYFIGDSITAGTGSDTLYHMYLSAKLGAHCYNYGVAGSGFAYNVSSESAIISGEGVEGDGSSNVVSYNNTFENMANTIPADGDLYVVFGGTNDYGQNIPINNFASAVNQTIENLFTRTDSNKILFITPTLRNRTTGNFKDGRQPNNIDLTLSNYVTTIVNRCKYYGVTCINLHENGGLNPYLTNIRTKYMPDGLHPNAYGHKIIADYVYPYFKQILGYVE